MAFKTWAYNEKPLASADLNGNFALVKVLASSIKDYASFTSNIAKNYNNQSLTFTRGVLYRFSSFTLSSATISIDSTAGNNGKPVIILVDGDVSITGGTINLAGKGFAKGTGGAAVTGNPQDGNDGTAGTQYTDGLTSTYYSPTAGGVSGKKGVTSGGTAAGGAGGGAVTFTSVGASYIPQDINTAFNVFGGAGGAGGGSGAHSGLSGAGGGGGGGGAGGGSIIIIAGGNLTFSGGTITCAGVAGSNGGNASGNSDHNSNAGGGGGGGGGAGGDIVLAYVGTYTSGGTATVTGGAAGTGGTKYIYGVSPTYASGGGGGSGGASSSSNSLAGGTAGDASSGARATDGAAGSAGGNGTVYTIDLTP